MKADGLSAGGVNPVFLALVRQPWVCYPLAVDINGNRPDRPRGGPSPLELPQLRPLRAFAMLLVLIGHLGLGFELLTHGPGFGAEAHDRSWLAAEGGDPDAHDEGGCDHCGHASAHLLGVLPHRTSPFPRLLSVPRAGYGGIWRSHNPPPPTRPPKYSL